MANNSYANSSIGSMLSVQFIFSDLTHCEHRHSKIDKIPRNLFGTHFHTQIHAYLEISKLMTPGQL
jgi:hypothetical protein